MLETSLKCAISKTARKAIVIAQNDPLPSPPTKGQFLLSYQLIKATLRGTGIWKLSPIAAVGGISGTSCAGGWLSRLASLLL
jgi:hypothetical protein